MTATLTLTATLRGVIGNSYTLAKSGTNLVIGAATFSGGADEPAGAFSYEAGRQTFSVAADQWTDEKTNAMSAVEQIVNSEFGLFWVARDGTLIFKNRDYLFKRVAAAAVLTLTGQQTDMAGKLAQQDITNYVVVSFTPRANLASGVIAKAQSEVVAPGQSGLERWNGTVVNPGGGNVVIKLPFTDPSSGRPMGARSIITPLVAGTDYNAGDGSGGTNYNSYAGLTFSVANNGSNAEISIHNQALGPLYVSSLKLRGVGVVAYDAMQVVRENVASGDSRHVRAISLPLPSTQNFADAIAAYILSKNNSPYYRLESLTFVNITKIGAVSLYSLEIGDVIVASETQVGLASQRYVVLGIRYGAGADGSRSITFDVRRLDDVSYGVYDDTTYGKYDTTFRYAL